MTYSQLRQMTTAGWWLLRDDIPRHFYCQRNNVKTRRVEHIARTGGRRLRRYPEKKRPLWKFRHRQTDNIKADHESNFGGSGISSSESGDGIVAGEVPE